MPQNHAAKGPSETAVLLGRIANLEAENAKLRLTHTLNETPLPAREALLAEVEKIAHLGSWFLDLETMEVKWSDELFHILGFDPVKDKASMEKFYEALHPEEREGYLANMDAMVKEGKIHATETRLVWKDGAVRQVVTNGAALHDAGGKVIRLVGTLMDVTEIRRAERERSQLEIQLRQAQKMEVAGRMAGGVAHDFNNLLTIISGNADLLLEQNPDERLQHIRDAAEVGATLTRQLLAFSRQAEVKPVAVDLNTVVHEMVRILGRLLGEDIQIRLEMGIESATILADRGQMQQIVLNLAVNARDAMPSGGHLTFATEESFGPPLMGEIGGDGHGSSLSQRWVELSVKDTGIGMDASIRERAFEPFFTTKEPGKGTGLGLSTVQDIVAKSSGTIHIASQPGAGTKVTVRFPRYIETTYQTATFKDSGNKIEPIMPETEVKPNIMLVEDNPDLRELVANFLTTAGYRVLALGRPGEAEALWQAEGSKIDLLIADMSMPGKNGLELAKVLVSQKQNLKTLFISEYSPHRHGLTNSAFLQKPFTRKELLMAVSQLCSPLKAASKDSDSKKEKVRPKLVPFPKSPPPGPG